MGQCYRLFLEEIKTKTLTAEELIEIANRHKNQISQKISTLSEFREAVKVPSRPHFYYKTIILPAISVMHPTALELKDIEVLKADLEKIDRHLEKCLERIPVTTSLPFLLVKLRDERPKCYSAIQEAIKDGAVAIVSTRRYNVLDFQIGTGAIGEFFRCFDYKYWQELSLNVLSRGNAVPAQSLKSENPPAKDDLYFLDKYSQKARNSACPDPATDVTSSVKALRR